jgi:hypothetical protein
MYWTRKDYEMQKCMALFVLAQSLDYYCNIQILHFEKPLKRQRKKEKEIENTPTR